MYSIRQFRPTLYVLLLLGITGFCFAAASPGLWLIAVAMIGAALLFVVTETWCANYQESWVRHLATPKCRGCLK